MSKNKIIDVIILFSILWYPYYSVANSLDLQTVWPLCGRISEESPEKSEWKAGENCPEERLGSAKHNDFPLSSTFGPRQLVSGGYRYDFHRGLDIPTYTGTPIFAIADGIVRKAGEDSAYSDPMIMLLHFQQGYTGTSCSISGGCFHSLYLHLYGWTVKKGDSVSKGDLIGYTGASQSGFSHLHFEIRKAPSEDPYSAWQRDAIHPLSILPYEYQSDSNIDILIENVNENGNLLNVTAKATVPMDRLDLVRIEVKVFNKCSKSLVPQRGKSANEKGYHVRPAWFDLEVWNREYTHKNSRKYPWESFGKGGTRECPYHNNHSDTYSANIHMDQAYDSDYQVGYFNGVSIAPNHYNANSSEYVTRYTFHNLLAADGGLSNSCIVVEATDIKGAVKTTEYNCSD
ncbi:M23 family metallopeptidase [Candidatus Marithrix sp. Canyon 246]|uniref:M23 family metallopeptidase n=1 Tax=Candidatus Marithrix sp. Canyon 246 TaxID=1827136 RepID=UPI000849F9D7|nr:M23 family metallopeptidase [Candidatus Marithrix sp. Canyon 246]